MAVRALLEKKSLQKIRLTKSGMVFQIVLKLELVHHFLLIKDQFQHIYLNRYKFTIQNKKPFSQSTHFDKTPIFAHKRHISNQYFPMQEKPQEKGATSKDALKQQPNTDAQSKPQQQKTQLPTLSPKKKTSSQSVTIEDFKVKYSLGKGAYGDVFLVEKKSNQQLFAMKEILKKKLQREKKQYQALIEKQILSVLKHPAITRLRYAFQDKKSLYFVMERCEGGEFIQFMKLNLDKLNENIKRFYIAEIVLVLEYLHKSGITHRDLKPENLMLSETGHIKIIDFGTADISESKILKESFKEKIASMKQKNKEQEQKMEQIQAYDDSDDEDLQLGRESPKSPRRRATFVGTCYYISPELLQENYCPPAADLWALGCILYQMYYFKTPFSDTYEFAVFENIKKCNLQFPPNKDITPQAKDLIQKLLRKNPDERLGSGKSPNLTYERLKAHPFFKQLNFETLFEQKVPSIESLQQPVPLKQTKESAQQKQQMRQRTRTQFTKQVIQSFDLLNQEKKEPINKSGSKAILFHGVVEKRTFVKYSYYYLILFEDLTIERVKSDQIDKKKVLTIATKNKKPTHLPAKLIQKDKFELQTTQKTYSFKSEQMASKWVQVINKRFKELTLK